MSHEESGIAGSGAPMRLAWVRRGGLGPGGFAGMPGLDEAAPHDGRWPVDMLDEVK